MPRNHPVPSRRAVLGGERKCRQIPEHGQFGRNGPLHQESAHRHRQDHGREGDPTGVQGELSGLFHQGLHVRKL